MKKLNFITLLGFIILAGCSKAPNTHEDKLPTLYQSSDWITDNEFTNGIEGPAVAEDGSLYVVNYQEQGTIGRVLGKNNVELFVRLPNNSIGNGIQFDQQGNMYIADYVNHNVLIVRKDKSNGQFVNEVKTYAHSSLMNQPNDIAMMDNGIIFASDPNWSNGTGNLWRINKNAQVTLLEGDMGTTNGVAMSPNNKTLYVNESVQRNVWQYEIDDSGNISNKRLLINFPDHGLDGMRTDKHGRLFIARYGKGVVAIISPDGELLKEVKLKGRFPTNVAFGGEQQKQVFVTMQKRGAIETFFID